MTGKWRIIERYTSDDCAMRVWTGYREGDIYITNDPPLCDQTQLPCSYENCPEEKEVIDD